MKLPKYQQDQLDACCDAHNREQVGMRLAMEDEIKACVIKLLSNRDATVATASLVLNIENIKNQPLGALMTDIDHILSMASAMNNTIEDMLGDALETTVLTNLYTIGRG